MYYLRLWKYDVVKLREVGKFVFVVFEVSWFVVFSKFIF